MNTSIKAYWKMVSYIMIAVMGMGLVGLTTQVRADENLFVITETDGSTKVVEGGATDTFEISLDQELGPREFANFYTEIDPDSQVSVSPSTLEFNSENWNIPVTVTVTANNDIEVENTTKEIISFVDYSSVEQANISPQSVTDYGEVEVMVYDNDGVLIDGYTPEMSITEGESIELELFLGSSPLINESEAIARRDITVSSLDNPYEVLITTPEYIPPELQPNSTEESLTFSPDSLSFTSEGNSSNINVFNFNIPQTLTITAPDNEINDGNRVIGTTLGVDAEGNNFDILDDIELSFTIEDNDSPATVDPIPEDNNSQSNKTSSCSDIEIIDGGDDDCDGVVCEESRVLDPDDDCDGYPNSGDANNDGILDADQDNVVTTRNEKSTFTTKTDTALRNVQQRTLSREIDKSSPLLAQAGLAVEDIISFEVDASQSSVELYIFTEQITDNEGNVVEIKDLDKSSPQLAETLKAAKIDPDTGEVTVIESAIVSIITIDGVDTIKITYDIEDGGDLDADGTVNGTIVDPVGLLYFGEEEVVPGLIRTGGRD